MNIFSCIIFLFLLLPAFNFKLQKHNGDLNICPSRNHLQLASSYFVQGPFGAYWDQISDLQAGHFDLTFNFSFLSNSNTLGILPYFYPAIV